MRKILCHLTQYASKRDHLWDMKIANFQNLFRDAWGCWQDPLRPKSFGPGCTGRPIQPILSTIFSYFSNFALQKNSIKCSVLTTFLHLDSRGSYQHPQASLKRFGLRFSYPASGLFSWHTVLITQKILLVRFSASFRRLEESTQWKKAVMFFSSDFLLVLTYS